MKIRADGPDMNATSLEETADTSPRARWKRMRLIIVPVIAVQAAAGAFAAWGPIGIGPGPIGNRQSAYSDTDPVSRTQPAWLVVPVEAGHSGATIDRINVLSDGSYPAPRVIAIKGDGDQVCSGVWPVAGPENFYANCVAGGLVPLLGRPVPARSHVNVPSLGLVNYPGIGAAIEAAPPGPAGCWNVTKFVMHYHVGIRHYTATYSISETACWSKSQLAALRP